MNRNSRWRAGTALSILRAATLALVACAPVPAAERMEAFEIVGETEHLVFLRQGSDIGEEGLEYGMRQGERYIKAIVELTGESPRGKIDILLRGPAEGSDGRRGYPHVDKNGRVHLFRYGPTFHGYFGAVPHELVHSLRIHRQPHHDWFFEEGFAEFVALRVGKSMKGFPWYETPVVIAAGQWLVRDEAIPLTTLRERHREVSLPCKAQTYTLRSDFFDYLGRRFGDRAVLEMSRRPEAGRLEDYTAIFGFGLVDLEKAWREDLLARYRSVKDADAQARRYREETPIQYMGVCRAGTDF